MSLSKDDRVECTIESLAFGGRGLAHVDNMAIFVEHGLPGDRVRARVVRAKKRFAEAVTEEVLQPSPHRVEPRCPHFGVCGGCSLQSLDYTEQLAQKAAQVESALTRIGGVEAPIMEAAAGSPEIWAYRNKMEFVFAGGDAGLHLGLRQVSGVGENGLPPVLDVTGCCLCTSRDMDILAEVRRFCADSGVPAFDPHERDGFWRHLVIRRTSTGQVLVHCITTPEHEHFHLAQKLGETLADRFPDMTSFVHSTRKGRGLVAVGDRVEFRLGTKVVEERVVHGDREARYHISPNAFFQTNTPGAGELFGTVRDLGEFRGDEVLLDLYCGLGAIGIFLADRVARVVGVEVSHEAVTKAYDSAALNDLDNCEFTAAPLDNGLAGVKGVPAPDVVVVDPPRSGIHPDTIQAILDLSPEKILAVSCDPNTLARDVKRLSGEYILKRARAVDMFPHTHHVETVALLVRR